MEIFLTNQVKAVTGKLDNYTGYYIRRRGNNFYSACNPRSGVPADGHWRFIVMCAEQCRRGLYFRDIRVGYLEMIIALHEAGKYNAAIHICRPIYNAEQILEFKELNCL